MICVILFLMCVWLLLIMHWRDRGTRHYDKLMDITNAQARKEKCQQHFDERFEIRARQQGYEHYLELRNDPHALLIIKPFNEGKYMVYDEASAKYCKGEGTYYHDLVKKECQRFCNNDREFPRTTYKYFLARTVGIEPTHQDLESQSPPLA